MKHKRKFTESEEQNIIDMYKIKKHLGLIREYYNTSVENIKEILHKYNFNTSKKVVPLNENYFEYIDSNDKAYWLGFISADGCIHKNKYKLSFCIKDSDILQKFNIAISSGHPIRYYESYDKRTLKTYSQYSLQICSKKFCNFIKSHGVDENKSKIFDFPKIEEQYYSHFIRGLYDGDGSIQLKISKVENKITFRVNMLSSLSCITHIKNYLNTLSINSQKIISKENWNIHYISLQKDAIKFLEWIYKNSNESNRLDRKYLKYATCLEEFDKQIFTLKNHKTDEIHTTKNLNKFCQENNLNDNFLRKNKKLNKIPIRGKHINWELL